VQQEVSQNISCALLLSLLRFSLLMMLQHPFCLSVRFCRAIEATTTIYAERASYKSQVVRDG
jgi:hypothetical protein